MEQNYLTLNNLFPDSHTICGKYPKVSNYLIEAGWTSGFWTGMLWMMTMYSKEKKYQLLAEYHLTSFRARLREEILINHHDLGFLFLPSAYSQYKLTNFSKAKDTVVWAADKLCERFVVPGEYIQAWGEIDKNKNGKFIIDCNLNVPLLFKAHDLTGEQKYLDIAVKHLKTASQLLIRNDGSTFHSFNMNAIDGKPLFGETVQGFSDTSCWSRGQAWAVYGFAIAYKRTGLEIFKQPYFKVTSYFIKNLPNDLVPYWDLVFTDADSATQEKDTSAAAIFINGVLTMSETLGEENSEFKDIAIKCLESLTQNYLSDQNSEGILSQGVYNKN
ncbi:glycoside hydrolase family 88 protein [Spiroplasma clarkii]|uniref:glycoside hydrolase family 88 protein n=1 Tax=Spiroplasma clarkii TaxID=2139 RepID=UPI0011BAB9DD|nr:glycoside hydrolase family 88 protein [Spiroplasma clarkii]